jgi:hypothetical protein
MLGKLILRLGTNHAGECALNARLGLPPAAAPWRYEMALCCQHSNALHCTGIRNKILLLKTIKGKSNHATWR